MPDNNLNRGQPDRALLNRHESYEVEYFAKEFARKHSSMPRDEAIGKVKRLLALVPSHLRSHEHVEDWLVSNWTTHK